MSLEIERSGGFAGLTLQAVIPIEELSAGQRAALETALARPGAPPLGPDRYQYRLAIEGRQAILQEHELPVALRGLLHRLQPRP